MCYSCILCLFCVFCSVVNTAVLQVYLVVGGWRSGGWTDSTETLVEGGAAWTLHTGSLPVSAGSLPGGFGDGGVLNYYGVLYYFGGEESKDGGGYRDRQRPRLQRSEIS